MWSFDLKYALPNICVVSIFKFVTCKCEGSNIWSRICPFYLVWNFNVTTQNFANPFEFSLPWLFIFFGFFSFFTCVKF
jgi:hypothetical protein